MDKLIPSLDLGTYTETKQLMPYTGEDLALRYPYNRDVIIGYFTALYKYSKQFKIYMQGTATLYVATLLENKGGISKSILRLSGSNANLYLTVGELCIEREVKVLKLKTGLTKPTTLITDIAPKTVDSTLPNLVKDSKGEMWSVPEEWLRELEGK